MNSKFNVKAFITGVIYTFIRKSQLNSFLDKYHPIIANKNRIETNDPLIFVANHTHMNDQQLIIASTDRVIHWEAKKEYFDGTASFSKNHTRIKGLQAALMVRGMGCIPIDRTDTLPILARKYNTTVEELIKINNLNESVIYPDQEILVPKDNALIQYIVKKGNNTKTFKEIENYLSYGHSIGVFPEGTRTLDGTLGAFAKGPILTAIKNDVFIQPAAISGTFDKNNADLIINFLSTFEVAKDSSVEEENERLRSVIKNGIEENKALLKTLGESKKLGKETIYL